MLVFFIITIILLCILMLPFNIVITYDNGFRTVLQFLVFKFKVIPPNQKKNLKSKEFIEELKKERRKKRIISLHKKSNQNGLKKKYSAKKYTTEDIPFYFTLIKDFVSKSYSSIRGGLTVKVKKINISVANEDAAKTAIEYGAVSQSLAYLLQFFDTIAKVKYSKSSINISADFLSTKTIFSFQIVLSWKLWRAIIVFIAILYRALFALSVHNNRKNSKNIKSHKHTTEEKTKWQKVN